MIAIGSMQAAMLVAVAVFVMVLAAGRLVQALRAREALIARAEDLGADPAVLSDPLRRKSFLVRWADRYDRSPAASPDRERLRKAYLKWNPSDFRVVRLALGFGIGYVSVLTFKLPWIAAVLLALGAYFIVPRLFLRSRRNAYVNAFNGQLVEITQLLANALRAGMSIQQAIGQVPSRLPEPARGEFRQTHNELTLGDNLAMALSGLCRRVRSRDLDVVVNTMVVQHSAGGNLARVLAAMADILTERQRLAGEIRALTADARFSALIVMVMPLGLLLLIRDTPLGDALFGSVIGWGLLAAFAVVQVGVYFLIQRIATIEV